MVGYHVVPGGPDRHASVNRGKLSRVASRGGDGLASGAPGLVLQVAAPAGSDSPGFPGMVAFDSNYEYFCYAPDQWARLRLIEIGARLTELGLCRVTEGGLTRTVE